MVVRQEGPISYGIRERGGYYISLIRGRALSKVLPDPKETDVTLRVAVQKDIEAFVPKVWQATFWEMHIGNKSVLSVWQGWPFRVELQPSKQEPYWSTRRE